MVLSKEINYVQPFLKQGGENFYRASRNIFIVVLGTTRGTQLIVQVNYVRETFNAFLGTETERIFGKAVTPIHYNVLGK